MPNTGDKLWANTSLLLLFNGTAGTSVAKDSSRYANAVSARNGVALSSTQYLFGGTSMYFDGSNDILEINGAVSNTDGRFNFGTGDFCIEMFIWIGSSPSGDVRLINANFDPRDMPEVLLRADRTLMVYSNANWQYSTAAIPTSSWTHIALDRNGTTERLFIGGVLDKSWTDSANYSLSTGKIFIGALDNGSITGVYNGYMDSLRITKASRYQSNFTPPTEELPAFPFQAIPRKELAIKQPLRVNQNVTVSRMGL